MNSPLWHGWVTTQNLLSWATCTTHRQLSWSESLSPTVTATYISLVRDLVTFKSFLCHVSFIYLLDVLCSIYFPDFLHAVYFPGLLCCLSFLDLLCSVYFLDLVCSVYFLDFLCSTYFPDLSCSSYFLSFMSLLFTKENVSICRKQLRSNMHQLFFIAFPVDGLVDWFHFLANGNDESISVLCWLEIPWV